MNLELNIPLLLTTFLLALVIPIALQTVAIYLAARTFKYKNLDFRYLMLIASLSILGVWVVQTIVYLITGIVTITYLASIAISILLTAGLFKKQYSGSNWRVAGVWMLQHIYFFVTLLITAVMVRGWFVTPYVITGQSMSPTYIENDYLLIEHISKQHKRGDVVVHQSPQDRSKVLLKRIVGMPNETVIIEDGIVTILTSGGERFELSEPYVTKENRVNDSLVSSLETDEYFVLSDNRSEISDSREWGPIQKSDIVGKVWAPHFTKN